MPTRALNFCEAYYNAFVYFEPGTADKGIKYLASLHGTRKQVLELDLTDQMTVTENEVKYLCRLKKLRTLNLHGTSISPDGLVTLKAALPACQVTP